MKYKVKSYSFIPILQDIEDTMVYNSENSQTYPSENSMSPTPAYTPPAAFLGNSSDDHESPFIQSSVKDSSKRQCPPAILDPSGLAQIQYDSENSHHESSV